MGIHVTLFTDAFVNGQNLMMPAVFSPSKIDTK